MSRRTDAEKAELDAVQRLADDKIDTSDQPEIEVWREAVRGRFYRPIKQSVTIRLDADVVAWFKAHPSEGGYQTSINRALRTYIEQETKPNRR
jgi:uncharacterized protein (DUF4415 family)